MAVNRQLINVLKIFFVWWLGLIIVSFLALYLLPFKPRFPYWDSILSKQIPYQFIWHWANFDGPHYLTIAEKGYVGTGLIQAYFPFYPLLIYLLNKVVGNLLVTGLLISYLAFFIGLKIFQKLTNLEGFKKNNWSIIFLLLFPTSFYFVSLYSESLFLLLSLSSFLAMRQKKWLLSAGFASLASATRLVGIFIAPALMWEYFSNQSPADKKRILFWFKNILLGVISCLGFIIFCFYLNRHFGDPFYFAQVQSGFGASRQTDKLILLYQVIWRYLKMIITVKKTDILFYSIFQEFIISLFALCILIWGFLKKIRRSYLIFSFGSFFLPTLTGNFSSMPRYILLIFPIYFILGNIKSHRKKLVLAIIFGCLLVINTALFLRGFWIA